MTWPLVRDDHGALIPEERAADPLRGLWHDRTRPFEIPWGNILWPLGFLGWFYLFWVPSRPVFNGVRDLWPLVIYVAYFAGWIVYMRRSAKRPGSSFWMAVWSRIAWLAAYRHCGACGYSLAEVEPGGDGFATCPECGSAWHRDRWTLEGRDPRQDRALLAWLRRSHDTKRNGFDDRGLPITMRVGWMPRWIGDAWVPPDMRSRVRERLARVARRRIAWMGATALVAWVVAFVVLMRVRDPLPRDWWSDFQVIGVITWMMYMGVLYVIVRTSVRSTDVRAAVIDEDRCPSCGEGLAGRETQFDGCVTCGRCLHAWRRTVYP
jgi:uncharacterized Zn finger protein (UPF0148 family)